MLVVLVVPLVARVLVLVVEGQFAWCSLHYKPRTSKDYTLLLQSASKKLEHDGKANFNNNLPPNLTLDRRSVWVVHCLVE